MEFGSRSFSLSLFKDGGSFCFLVYFIWRKIRGRIRRKFTLLRIIMYGKKWNLDLIFSLSLFKVVVLSVFWFILFYFIWRKIGGRIRGKFTLF